MKMKKLVDQTESIVNDPVDSNIEALHLMATRTTPEVILNPSKGIFKISGRSMPEDCRNFYQPIINWVRRFSKIDGVQITVEFDLDYFNSSTAVFLLYIMKIFNEMNAKELSKVVFVWKYQIDDESLFEAGQEYAEIIGSSFLISKYS